MSKFSLHDYLDKVKTLPVTLGNMDRILAGKVPTVEEKTGDIRITASHQHVPVLGNVYVISITKEGPNADTECGLMRNALVRELGEPNMESMGDP